MRTIVAAIAALAFAFAATAVSAQQRKVAAMPEATFPFVGKTCAGMLNGKYSYEFTWKGFSGNTLTGELVVDGYRGEYVEPVTATFENGRLVGNATRLKWERTFDFQVTPTGLTGQVKGVRKTWTISGTLTCS